MNLRSVIHDLRLSGSVGGAYPPARSKIINHGSQRRHSFPARRGSVLVVVLVTLIFTAFVLTAFIDKASTDLIVETRSADMRRLRQEAYSALEATLCVLEEFRRVGGGLRSPAEGWNDPLAFAGWEPTEGRTVTVTFEDESGKLPLPRVTPLQLVALFEHWEVPKPDAEELADALMTWMKKEHVPTSLATPDYELSELPYGPPYRSLRSFHELAAIQHVREKFYDENGRPNELWHRFAAAVSLYNFRKPNLNSAPADVTAALGGFDELQQKQLGDYFTGEGLFLGKGPQFFRAPGDVGLVLGDQVNVNDFETQIRALRIRITVRQGLATFQLNTVVAPPNGASLVPSSATTNPQTTQSPNGRNPSTPPPSNPATPGASSPSTAPQKKLNYPFTLLEIRENDEPSSAAPPPPEIPI